MDLKMQQWVDQHVINYKRNPHETIMDMLTDLNFIVKLTLERQTAQMMKALSTRQQQYDKFLEAIKEL